MKSFRLCIAIATVVGVSACAGQTPTQQRTLSGAAIGGAGGAAIGAIAGNAGLAAPPAPPIAAPLSVRC